ncbi:MAG: hypothetical protein ACYTGQ_04060, partial [Planctomycetota bacterium]
MAKKKTTKKIAKKTVKKTAKKVAKKTAKKTAKKAPTKKFARAAKTVKKKVRRKKTEDTGKKLMDLANSIAAQAKKQLDPGVDIPTRSLANVSFNKRKGLIEMGDNTQRRSFFNLGQAKKFMQTTLIASGCKALNDQKKTTSIRDLFYHCKHTIPGTRENTFDEQSESDPIIEDLEVTLASMREELGLFAEPKGAMVGPMVIE